MIKNIPHGEKTSSDQHFRSFQGQKRGVEISVETNRIHGFSGDWVVQFTTGDPIISKIL